MGYDNMTFLERTDLSQGDTQHVGYTNAHKSLKKNTILPVAKKYKDT